MEEGDVLLSVMGQNAALLQASDLEGLCVANYARVVVTLSGVDISSPRTLTHAKPQAGKRAPSSSHHLAGRFVQAGADRRRVDIRHGAANFRSPPEGAENRRHPRAARIHAGRTTHSLGPHTTRPPSFFVGENHERRYRLLPNKPRGTDRTARRGGTGLFIFH